MTKRERLIKLLDEAFISADDNYGTPNTNQVADYLLDNGVIVPPCKVGATVYIDRKTWGCKYNYYDYRVIRGMFYIAGEVVSIVKTRKQILMKLKVKNRTRLISEYKRYPISAIGKTVFFSREEAEKALKEREKE